MGLDTNKEYDEIVGKIMQNVINQSTYTNNKIVLWDFQQLQSPDRLYYNVACIVADLFEQQIYLQMPLLDFLKFKRKHKKRKNIHWVSKNARWIPVEGQTSVYIIMDFIRSYYGFEMNKFKEINDEYYGWIE